MKKIKEVREYIILAYEPKTLEYLKDLGYNLSPKYFMRVKESSKLGRLIKSIAKRQEVSGEFKGKEVKG